MNRDFSCYRTLDSVDDVELNERKEDDKLVLHNIRFPS